MEEDHEDYKEPSSVLAIAVGKILESNNVVFGGAKTNDTVYKM